MKKVSALVLALILICSLSVSAFAGTTSVVAPKETKEETADMPKVVDASGDIKIVPTEELTVEQEAAVEEAVESVDKIFSGEPENLKEVFGDDIETVKAIFGEDIESVEDIDFEAITVNFVNYVESTLLEDGNVTIELEGDFSEVIAMLFVDGKWIKINVKANEDGTFTLAIPSSGVLAIMTK